ncbi:MAG: polysaccharide biosynthesis tyrosine autokinase [Odoribacteraceae bacterium]|jgi:capsular exopolysaccharide synthesis family protein|nr:polysaccharide biosynthesis tyrosine autokinase [Odoribacteraceae bacterium]
MQQTDPSINNEESVDFQEIFFRYLSYWKYFVGTVILCLVCAIAYLWYTTPTYRVSAKILIKDEKRGQTGTELNVFKDLGLLNSSGNVDNELEILKSRSLLQKVCDSLDWHISYYTRKGIKNVELYQDAPIKLYVTNATGATGWLSVTLQEDGKFLVKDDDRNFSTSLYAGEKTESPYGILNIHFSGGSAGYPVWIHIAHSQRPTLNIVNTNKSSGVFEISTVSSCPRKSEDVINTLVYFYNLSSIADKRWSNDQTIAFINARLDSISVQLEKIEKKVESYKKTNELTNIEAEAGLYLSTGSEYDKRISEIEIQKEMLTSIEHFLLDEANRYNVVPSTIIANGSSVLGNDASLLSIMTAYNETQRKRREYGAGMTAANPIMIELDKQLNLQRNDLLKSIQSTTRNYETTLKGLRQKESTYSTKIRNLSTNEREYYEFSRQSKFVESIYLYLLQKREESAISISMIMPNANIIDEAYVEPIPVQPKKAIVLLAALLLGFIIPIVVIYLRDLLNFKIRNRDELAQLVKAPILGIVSEGKKRYTDIIIQEGDRSHAVEMYRQLATNLKFIMSGPNDKVVMVTSSMPHEGKSTFAINLGLTWATTGKKTLLVDMDMRASKIKDLLAITESQGMSNYLSNKQLYQKEIITPSKQHANLDVALSGIFPPNPVELLWNNRLEEFFAYAREQYDYIIVDTPPALVVTDALIINRICDASIYVTRADITHKKMMLHSEELYREKKLTNMTYVLKGIISGKSGYGYGYEYGQYYSDTSDTYYGENTHARKKPRS